MLAALATATVAASAPPPAYVAHVAERVMAVLKNSKRLGVRGGVRGGARGGDRSTADLDIFLAAAATATVPAQTGAEAGTDIDSVAPPAAEAATALKKG